MIRKRIIFIVLYFCFNTCLNAQQLTISGTVRDATNGELLNGAAVSDSISGIGTQTNAYGFFSIKLPSSNNFLKISYVGYISVYIHDFTNLNFPFEFRLFQSNNLSEITIRENKGFETPIGSLSIVENIKSIPSLFGEVDVLKALSLTPGVGAGTEGSAGLYVRGGTPDQNLILLDEVPVYNVTHLGGFFSVFNPNSIKSIDLYKGAFPARYGGRLASVIDLTMKDGNNQKFGGEVGIGILNQNLTLEGPIIRNKASFIISGRISTLGLTSLLHRKRPENGSGEQYKYKFYDFNTKLNYQINKTDQLFISFYNGFDRFKYEEWNNSKGLNTSNAIGNNWGNTTGTIRYSKVLSKKLFSRLAILYSKYTSEFTNDLQDISLIDKKQDQFYRYTDASVEDFGGKLQFDYFPLNALTLKFGVDATKHIFSPFTTKTNYKSISENSNQNQLPAIQMDAYLDGNFSFKKQVSLNVGFRYSLYKLKNKTFYNPEPRIGFNWSLPKNWKIKTGYSVMNQYLHLLTNNGYGFGYDAWLPSTDIVSPSRAKQLSIGLIKNLSKTGLEISLEVYTKSLKNIIDYPDGTNFTGLLAESWDRTVSKGGIGRGKGIEFMISKNSGKLNGWISYTLSKSDQKFNDLNNGKWYPIKYDRRHNLSITGSYSISKKWKLSSTFIYQTGHAVTLPSAAILTEGNADPRFIYTGKNNGRMPDYHRLDLGATRFLTTTNNRKAELNFGLFNAYNHNNPAYLDITIGKDDMGLKPIKINIKQYSLFPILPYISYSIKF
jgi:outer membrane receptor for ferrienterochelin and colicin